MIFKKVSMQTDIWITSNSEHHQIKQKILDAILSMGIHSNIECGQKISNTDWHLSPNTKRPYWEIIASLLEQHHSSIEGNFTTGKKIQTRNYWFQQYGLNDFHEWHLHDSAFSNIYYVELPYGSATTFRSTAGEFTINVEEGDLITFPSIFEHCSKPNKNNETKTVIAYNSFII